MSYLSKTIVILMVWNISFLPLVGAISGVRFFSEEFASITEASALQILLGRISNLVTLAIFALYVTLAIKSFLRKNKLKIILLVGFSSYYLSLALSSIFGTDPSFSTNHIIYLLAGLSLILLTNPKNGDIIKVTIEKSIRYIFIYGSLLSMLIAPDWAYENNYTDSLIQLPIRLHGTAPHANVLSYIIAFYIIINLSKNTSELSKHEKFNLSLAFFILFLTQSKTQIAATLIAAAFIYYYKTTKHLKLKLSTQSIFIFATIAIVLLFSLVDPFGHFDKLYNYLLLYHDNILTFTGRKEVWDVTVNVWLQNPIFGYGTNLWDIDMRQSYLPTLGWAVPHAHSQFYQTLGESGIIGIISLIIYISILSYIALKISSISSFFSIGVILIMITRSFSEPVFRGVVLGDGNFTIHAFILLMFSIYISQIKKEKANENFSQTRIQKRKRQPI